MKTKLAQRLVADFWERVGSEEPFPRQLERSIMATTPVFIVKVHHQRLDTSYIRNRLQRRGVHLPTAWATRRLNGCLVAYKGEAAIFVDGTLSAEEVRVIIAHEFGHYLADYEGPRLQAVRGLGNGIVEVLDGVRPPTTAELLAATLAQVSVGVYVHYMDRSTEAGVTSLVNEVEETANIVAAELLAPRHAVLAEMVGAGNCPNREAIVSTLEHRFGLATLFAEWYAGRLVTYLSRQRSFTDILGFGMRTTMES